MVAVIALLRTLWWSSCGFQWPLRWIRSKAIQHCCFCHHRMCRIGHIRKKKQSVALTLQPLKVNDDYMGNVSFDNLTSWFTHLRSNFNPFPPGIPGEGWSFEWWLSGSSAVAPHPAGPGGGRRRQRASERPVFGTARRTTGATFRGGIVVGTSCTFG